MDTEHLTEHLRLRSQRAQEPAPQRPARAYEEHQSGHPL
jgi:hypothetical protein